MVVEKTLQRFIEKPFYAVILSPSLVILSEAKNLLFISDSENKSRFFSPANTAGLQNDTHLAGFFNKLLGGTE